MCRGEGPACVGVSGVRFGYGKIQRLCSAYESKLVVQLKKGRLRHAVQPDFSRQISLDPGHMEDLFGNRADPRNLFALDHLKQIATKGPRVERWRGNAH